MTGEPPNPPPDDKNVSASAPVPAASSRRSGSPAQAYGTPRPAGHGQRLTAAFEALERFPALAESRNRVLALVSENRPASGDVVAAIESDVALVISVLRLANRLDHDRRGRVESVVEAVEILS